jgi:hypothetical protein
VSDATVNPRNSRKSCSSILRRVVADLVVGRSLASATARDIVREMRLDLPLVTAVVLVLVLVIASACESESPVAGGGAVLDGGGGNPDGAVGPVADAAGDDATIDAAVDAAKPAKPPLFPRSLPTSGVCSHDGWCFVNPVPLPNLMHGVWGTSETDMWFVGEDAIVHYDGVGFRGIAGLGGRTFRVVTGSGPNDAWALADDNFLLRWNGTTWSESPVTSSFKLKRIWSRAPDDAWVVGASGTILHWDGTSWKPSPSGTVDDLSGVFGFAANDVWAVGGGTVRHFNGTTWTDPPSAPPAGIAFTSLWGASPTDIWFAGSQFVHFDGAQWKSQAGPATAVAAIWDKRAGSSTTSYYYDAGTSTWKLLSVGAGPGLWGAGGNYYIANPLTFGPSFSSMTKWNASFELTALVKSAAIDAGVQFVWAGGANDVWIASKTSVYRGDGASLNWTKQSWGATTATVKAITGRSATDAWIAADSGIASHWDGMTFTPYAIASGEVSPVTSAAPNDAWILVGQNAYHWNGSVWSDKGKASDTPVGAIYGFGDGEAWAARSAPAGNVTHLSGGTWTPMTNISGFHILSLWGSAANAVSLVDDSGGIARWNGQSWTSLGTSHGVKNTWLTATLWQSANDLWAVHDLFGTVSHFDGTAWESESVGAPSSLSGIARASSGDLWVVGQDISAGGRALIAHKAP